MMCYKDMTFCQFWLTCCKGSDCKRAVTKEVQEAAKKWWGGEDPPFACFAKKPECYEE